MLHFDQGGELKRTFLITAVDRNKNAQLRLRALQEIAASRDAEAFDRALDFVESWPRDDKREGVKAVLLALAEKKIGRRDQANNWIWRCANMTREVHEEYAVQRWPETKRLLGLLVNSSGGAHARNARRLVHAARQHDRRLAAALLAAAIPHTAEASEVINGARTRMSRKPAALARELLRNFPKGGKGRRGSRRRKKKGAAEGVAPEAVTVEAVGTPTEEESPLVAAAAAVEAAATAEEAPKPTRRRRAAKPVEEPGEAAAAASEEPAKPARRRRAAKPIEEEPGEAVAAVSEEPAKPARRRRAAKPIEEPGEVTAAVSEEAPKPARRRRAAKPVDEPAEAAAEVSAEPAKPVRRRRAAKPVEEPAAESDEAPKPTRRRRATAEPVDAPVPTDEAA
jgi:hypothetical protein